MKRTLLFMSLPIALSLGFPVVRQIPPARKRKTIFTAW
jgi:hypothetical protein